MNKVVTKRNMLIIGLSGTILLFGAFYSQTSGLCNYDNLCWDTINSTAGFFFLFPVMILSSLVTWWLNDQIFNSWRRFAYWWIPLSALIIFTTPTTDHSWALGGPTRQTMSFVMSGLFLFISLIIIAYKYFKLKKK